MIVHNKLKGCSDQHSPAGYSGRALLGGQRATLPWSGRIVGWLLNVPATCECISGTDLLRQFHVLPHWDRSCRPNFPSHPVTVYGHRANQSQYWPYNARRLAGKPLECQFLGHWYDSAPEKSRRKQDLNPGFSAIEADALTTRPTRRSPEAENYLLVA